MKIKTVIDFFLCVIIIVLMFLVALNFREQKKNFEEIRNRLQNLEMHVFEIEINTAPEYIGTVGEEVE